MSECVVRMKMPHDGLCDLAFSLLDRTCCTIEGNLCNYCDDGVIPKWCPIICKLPEGHGRLVDADALKDYLIAEAASYDLTQGQMGILSEAIDMIDEQPTIVPAEAERSET